MFHVGIDVAIAAPVPSWTHHCYRQISVALEIDVRIPTPLLLMSNSHGLVVKKDEQTNVPVRWKV